VDAWSKAVALVSAIEKSVGLLPGIGPSGFSPYDPRWMPADGWTKVWHFETVDELMDFANVALGGPYVVGNSIVTSPLLSLDTVFAWRYEEGVYAKRAAICFCIPMLRPNGWVPVVFIDSDDNVRGWTATSIRADAGPYALALYDRTYGPSTVFDYYGEWLVLVFDYEEARARVYQAAKGVVAELELTRMEPYGAYYDIYFIERLSGSYMEYGGLDYWHFYHGAKVRVDWVAVQVATGPKMII